MNQQITYFIRRDGNYKIYATNITDDSNQERLIVSLSYGSLLPDYRIHPNTNNTQPINQ